MQFYFSDSVLDPDRRELRRADLPVAIEPQVFDLLLYLLTHRNRVVSKDELFENIWNGRIVSDSAVNSRINSARKSIGDDGTSQTLIRTVPRKGYRFVAALQDGAIEVAPESRPAHFTMPEFTRPAIAVLPFKNLSGDRSQDYFSDGMSEDIITALSKLRWFLVIARNSSFTYKHNPVPLGQMAEELGARYVLEGSVRKDGTHVRITATLNDVASDGPIWSERYDRDLADVFAVQDEITEAIVAAIEPKLYVAETYRAQRKRTENLDAWSLVMRALSHHWRATRADSLAAQALLDKAVTLDPQYGQALGLLATNLAFGANMGWGELSSVLPRAERAAHDAVDADGADAWAHHGLGYCYLLQRRFDDALAEFELALRRNPNFALSHGFYGLGLCYSGRWQEGDAAARRALHLSPRDPMSAIYSGIAAYAQFVGRNYEAATRLALEALRQRSDFVGAHRVLTAAAGMHGDKELAVNALQGLRRSQPNVSLAWIQRELPLKHARDREHYVEGLRRAGLR